jgi:hypothetical protein
MVYEWKQNRFPVKAQDAGNELERIQNKYGGIMPKEVVAESRNKNSVLHPCFEWDNKKAAEGYREVQAREIIRNIVVVKVDHPREQEVKPVRAFVNVLVSENDNIARYVSINTAMSKEEYRKQILTQALKELGAFKEKYSSLKEFEKIFRDIDELPLLLNEQEVM